MRQDLLQTIKFGLSEYPEARRIAKADLTVTQLESKLAYALKLKALKSNYLYVAVMLAMIGTGVIFSGTLTKAGDWFIAFIITLPICVMVLVVGFLALQILFFVLRGCYDEYFLIESVSPIAKTDLCEVALKALEEGGPDVATWRDDAIAQRGQLYGFDVMVMCCLRDVHRYSIKRAEDAEKTARACALVHKLA